VAFHAPDQFDRCLVALERAVPVLVVDNSSSHAVAAVARSHGAEYFDSGRNVGYAAAVNSALQRLVDVDADVLLLNPDAVVRPSVVAGLAAFLHRDDNERVAVVAPRLVDLHGSEQRLVWPLPNPARMCAEAIGLGRIPTRRTFVAGAVLLLRREAIREVGYFDERFFLYAEETDWQRRAVQAGWTFAVCSDVVAAHAGGGTSADLQTREVLFHAGQETYIRKWYGPAGWWLYRVAACSGAAARSLVLADGRREDAARRMRLYMRGPRRCAAMRHL
jgi:GT2 family glycosyltransferase